MKCSEVIKRLEALAPQSFACEWDNVGLLAGWEDKEVRRVLIALDATDEVIGQGKELGVDLLLTHHPLIFRPLKAVNDGDFISRRILRLIGAGMNYYAMHTNFDAAPGGMADAAAGRLGLLSQKVLEGMGTTEVAGEEVEYGIGKLGLLPSPMSLKELALLLKERFHLPYLTVYGKEAVTEPVTQVAMVPGSGKGYAMMARDKGAQVLITGDIGHHDGIDAAANHLAIMDAGHYGLEHIFIDDMADYLKQEFGESLDIHKTAVSFPAALF